MNLDLPKNHAMAIPINTPTGQISMISLPRRLRKRSSALSRKPPFLSTASPQSGAMDDFIDISWMIHGCLIP